MGNLESQLEIAEANFDLFVDGLIECGFQELDIEDEGVPTAIFRKSYGPNIPEVYFLLDPAFEEGGEVKSLGGRIVFKAKELSPFLMGYIHETGFGRVMASMRSEVDIDVGYVRGARFQHNLNFVDPQDLTNSLSYLGSFNRLMTHYAAERARLADYVCPPELLGTA